MTITCTGPLGHDKGPGGTWSSRRKLKSSECLSARKKYDFKETTLPDLQLIFEFGSQLANLSGP